MSEPPTPAERAIAAIERAHRLYTTGRTSHAQYVAAVSVGIALSKTSQPTAGSAPREAEGFAKTWRLP